MEFETAKKKNADCWNLPIFHEDISFLGYSTRIFSVLYEQAQSLLLYKVRSDTTADHEINYSIQSMNQLSGIISLLSTCQEEEISKYSHQGSGANGISHVLQRKQLTLLCRVPGSPISHADGWRADRWLLKNTSWQRRCHRKQLPQKHSFSVMNEIVSSSFFMSS